MKTKLIKLFLIITILFISKFQTYSQDSYIKDRLSFKLSYMPIEKANEYHYFSEDNFFEDNIQSLHLCANYGFLNMIEAGGYIGFGFFEATKYEKNNDYGGFSSISNFGSSLYYGLNANFQILPLIVKRNDFRFDFYLKTQLGAVSYLTKDEYIPTKGTFFDYNVGAGLCFYPFTHMGVFTEFLYGSDVQGYESSSNARWNFGLVRKF